VRRDKDLTSSDADDPYEAERQQGVDIAAGFEKVWAG
jgi:hypothetical protein